MRSRLLLALGLLATLLVAGRGVAELLVEQAWYRAMGVPSLFWTALSNQLLLQGGAWGIGALFALANLHAVRRTILAVAVPVRIGNLEVTTLLPSRRLTLGTIILALLIGGILATPLGDWSAVALARHGLPFGELEGITGRDLGFYVYWLPLEETLYLWSLLSVVTSTTVVLLLYALTRSLRVEGRRVAVSAHVRRHLSVLAAVVLLLLAWSHRLDAFDVLQYGSGPDGLVMRVDHAVTLRMDRLLSILSVAAALVVLRTGWIGQLRSAMVTLTVVLVAAVGLRHAVPWLVAQGSWLGDPSRRESDYIAARALFSRRAFGVEAIRPVTDSVPIGARVGWHALSLWDPSALQAALPPVEPRAVAGPALHAAAPSMGWARTGAGIEVLAGRPQAALTGEWQWWRVAPDGAVVGPDGAPVVERADESDAPLMVAPGAERPLVVAREEVGDAPAMPLTGWRDRVLHAWALREPGLLGGEAERRPDEALVTYRDVRTRVMRVAPVFVQGAGLTPLYVEHRLFWVVHLYSASDRYPISQRWTVAGGTYGYFRLAATAILDAASGRVTLRPAAAPDPVARSWMQLVPSLFTPAPWVPPALIDLLPPPDDLLLVQLRTFARYGARFDEGPSRLLADSAWAGGPPVSHLMADHERVVPGWSLPLVDAGGLVVGAMRAVGGGAPRLEWQAVRGARPRWEALRAGTGTLEDSLRAAVESEERSGITRLVTRPALVDQQGTLLVLRTARAVSRSGRVLATRVAVTDGVRTGIGQTPEEASRRAMIDLPVGPAVRPAAGGEDPLERAALWYRRMREAMRVGDWSTFGIAFDSLGRDLRRGGR